MKFADTVLRVEEITAVNDKKALIKDGIRWGLDIIAESWNWPWLRQEGIITTVATYTTGTVSVTNNSASITGTGTTWTAAMVGRKIRFSGESAYYRIKTFTDATHLVLETVFQGTTNTAATYSIYKDEFRLPADCNKYNIMRQIEDSIPMTDLSSSAFDIIQPSPQSEGHPYFTIFIGTKIDTYSTGTIAMPVNTRIITGTGTAWTSVEGLGKGSLITIGSNVYTVKSVDSDTQITTYELALITSNAGTTYSILLDNLIIQFFTIPNAVENIYFRYQRRPAYLYNDQDIAELPDSWRHILVTAGCIWAWATKDKTQSAKDEAKFFTLIELMKRKTGCIGQSTRHFRKPLSIGGMYPGSPRYPSGYGVPFRV